MATLSIMPLAKANAPQEKPSVKLARPMTLPPRDPKALNGAKPRGGKQGEPFDPEDLTRRLTAHLVEQKARAKLRRDARAAHEAAAAAAAAVAERQGAGAPGVVLYHHIPKVAAAAFERTTTTTTNTAPDVVRRQVHKLAQPALKSHLEMLSLDEAPLPPLPLQLPGAGYAVTNLQRTQALDQVLVEREAIRNRNQFQWDRQMEGAAGVDLQRDVYRPPQRTFSEYAHVKSGSGQKHAQVVALRPLSLGDVLSEDDVAHHHHLHHHPATITKTRSKLLYDGRNDWAQQQEKGGDGGERRSVKGLVSPFLKKKESSIWILGGKRGKQQSGGAGITTAATTTTTTTTTTRCSPPSTNIDRTKGGGKASFLARFKRHPS